NPRHDEGRGGGSIRSAIGSHSARASGAEARTARGGDRHRYGRRRQLGCLDSQRFMAAARATTIPPGAGSRSLRRIGWGKLLRRMGDWIENTRWSAIRMIQYFINRGGRRLSASRRRELERPNARRKLGIPHDVLEAG
ncbi:MAG TPA: hypothetical protein VNZ24_01615, partial [Vicinamibacterales bacterium]|nr:hypothetical protein [Vicinamibacterales bacterium]